MLRSLVEIEEKDREDLKLDKSLIGVMIHPGVKAVFLIYELFV